MIDHPIAAIALACLFVGLALGYLLSRPSRRAEIDERPLAQWMGRDTFPCPVDGCQQRSYEAGPCLYHRRPKAPVVDLPMPAPLSIQRRARG